MILARKGNTTSDYVYNQTEDIVANNFAAQALTNR